ncbi:histidinol dehydrogenase [Hwanghaeella sp.]|uniref:histidinol dehydrogenase n=1 Tax=Hwanghaeella sp. TaxID=2605943 RepID=UPI003CCBAF2B
MEYLKQAPAPDESVDRSIRQTVDVMLTEIEKRREAAALEFAERLDGWTGDVVLSAEKRADLIAQVPGRLRRDIQFAHRQVSRFAEAQRDSLAEFEIETEPGVRLGQRVMPVQCAGCYVPGGRYAHIASAIMSIATAKVAGVPFVVACSPPYKGAIHPAIAYAMDLAGADVILEIGGVQGVAAMANGLFTGREADIIVGPGNAYVAEAKRVLFGRVGIDVFAGPTESAIIADESADPMTIAVDLTSQAEHGPNSPVWLFTTSRTVGEKVADLIPKVAADMPNEDVVMAAWRDYGDIVLCDDREEAVQISDRYAPEHVQVIAEDLQWWKANLRNYGSLFLGEGSTVTHGDKCSGTNHILPTKGAGRYSGGLSVHKFLKILTYQQLDAEANKTFSAVGSRISRAEGMDGHARACDWRLRKYFPDTQWDFEVTDQKRYET